MFELSLSPAIGTGVAPIPAASTGSSGDFAATLADLIDPAIQQGEAQAPLAPPDDQRLPATAGAVLPRARQIIADSGKNLPLATGLDEVDAGEVTLAWLEAAPDQSPGPSPAAPSTAIPVPVSIRRSATDAKAVLSSERPSVVPATQAVLTLASESKPARVDDADPAALREASAEPISPQPLALVVVGSTDERTVTLDKQPLPAASARLTPPSAPAREETPDEPGHQTAEAPQPSATPSASTKAAATDSEAARAPSLPKSPDRAEPSKAPAVTKPTKHASVASDAAAVSTLTAPEVTADRRAPATDKDRGDQAPLADQQVAAPVTVAQTEASQPPLPSAPQPQSQQIVPPQLPPAPPPANNAPSASLVTTTGRSGASTSSGVAAVVRSDERDTAAAKAPAPVNRSAPTIEAPAPGVGVVARRSARDVASANAPAPSNRSLPPTEAPAPRIADLIRQQVTIAIAAADGPAPVPLPDASVAAADLRPLQPSPTSALPPIDPAANPAPTFRSSIGTTAIVQPLRRVEGSSFDSSDSLTAVDPGPAPTVDVKRLVVNDQSTAPRAAVSDRAPTTVDQATQPLAPGLRVASPLPVLIGVPQPAAQAFATQIAAAAQRPLRDDRDDRTTSSASPIAAAATSQPHLNPVRSAANDAPVDTRHHDWANALIDRIDAIQDVANARDTRIRLIPDALGKIDVTLHRQGDTLNVQFTAEVAATRTLLADAQPRLAELAEARGLRLGQAQVGDGNPNSGQEQRRPPTAPLATTSNRRAHAQGDEGDPDRRIA